jgi:hypothetical protein
MSLQPLVGPKTSENGHPANPILARGNFLELPCTRNYFSIEETVDIISGDVYSLVNSRSSPLRNCCCHWTRDRALHKIKCSFVSQGAEHAGQHGEYLESFRLALSPTGRCLWLYFGTNRWFGVENRAELNAGQCMESYVSSSQLFRSFRYCVMLGAVAENWSEAWTFLVTVASTTSS